jgi:hypothetical protein
MDPGLDTLPDDVETLRAMVLAERAELAALETEVEQNEAELLAQIEENKVLAAERIRLGDVVETLTVRIPLIVGAGSMRWWAPVPRDRGRSGG